MLTLSDALSMTQLIEHYVCFHQVILQLPQEQHDAQASNDVQKFADDAYDCCRTVGHPHLRAHLFLWLESQQVLMRHGPRRVTCSLAGVSISADEAWSAARGARSFEAP